MLRERARATFRESDGYLIVPKLFDVPENMLKDLLRLHRPQNLSYDKMKGQRGESYKDDWAISTYMIADRTTYVRKCFEEKYDPRDCLDRPMLKYLEQRGVMDRLRSYKEEFLRLRGENLNLSKEAIELQIRSTTISQLFLTVQPSSEIMNYMKTSLQPHYDPCELTINIHLSPLDFRGCDPKENVLRIFRKGSLDCKSFSTAKGTCVFLWENMNNEACLHTANSIKRGSRVVLCAFFKDQRKNTSPSLLLEERSFQLPFHGVLEDPHIFRRMWKKHRYIFMNTSGVFQGSETIECILKESNRARFNEDGVCDLLSRGVYISNRKSLNDFCVFRSECASSAASKSNLNTILESVPSKLKHILQKEQLFFFNEFIFHVETSCSTFRRDKDEIYGFEQTEFFSIWFILQGTLEVAVKEHSSGRIDKVVLCGPYDSILFDSDTSYRFLSSQNHCIIWCLQYSTSTVQFPNGNVVAFSVPTCTQGSSSPISSSFSDVLSNTNGVVVEEREEKSSSQVMFEMKRAGDCVLVPGLTFHSSIPGESDVMLLKMVVFFCSETDLIKKARKFQTDMSTEDAFHEVVENWSNVFGSSIFSSYDEYYHTNSQTIKDQVKNVRRVHAHRLEEFCDTFPKCSELIKHISKTLGNCQVYDLHFLRQIGTNSASFSRHLDIHDTEDPETTKITCGVSVLMGGYKNCCCNEDEITRQKKRRRIEIDPTWLQFLFEHSTNQARQYYDDAVRRVCLIQDRFFGTEEEDICLKGCNCDDKKCLDCTCRFECGPSCSCNFSECENRPVQKELVNASMKFHVRWIDETKGFGVFTKVLVPKGTAVLEYVGEVITNLHRAQERMIIRESMSEMTFILTALERSHLDKKRIEQVTCIDAHSCGNISRFVNHSCDPNCDVECVRVGFKTPRLVFIATKDIPVGSEITISYGDGDDRGGVGMRPCKCGSKNCRGVLPRVSQF